MNISAIASTFGTPVPVLAPPGAAKDPKAAQTETAQRHKVAGQFEAILVRQMLSKSVGSMMGGADAASSVYGDMMTDVLAQNLTAGQGLGLGRMIEQQLTPHSAHAAKTGGSGTASAAKAHAKLAANLHPHLHASTSASAPSQP